MKSIVSILCSLALICAPLAEADNSHPVGMLASARAQINGTAGAAGSTIFAGDRIVSPEDASTAISLTGGSRLILANAGTLRMDATGNRPIAQLESGELAVLSHSVAPPLVEAAGTRITSRQGDAVYAVTVNGNRLQVTASRGEVAVEGAGRTVEVAEGRTLDATMAFPGRSDSNGGAPGAASRPLFTFQTVVLLSIAALAGAALAVAIKSLLRNCRSTTVSPSTVRCD